MNDITNWLLQRAKERSTWLGLVGLLSAVGIGLSPDQQEAIVSAGLGISGMILALSQDTDA